jgi:hypothetical protein
MEDMQEQSIDTHVEHSLGWRSDEAETRPSVIIAQFCEHTHSDVQVVGG